MTDGAADGADEQDQDAAEPAPPGGPAPVPKPPRSDADRAVTIARCVAIMERRGKPTAAILRVLAQLRPGQPTPTAEERVPPEQPRRAFKPKPGSAFSMAALPKRARRKA